jgi:hypothetical protein
MNNPTISSYVHFLIDGNKHKGTFRTNKNIQEHSEQIRKCHYKSILSNNHLNIILVMLEVLLISLLCPSKIEVALKSPLNL